MTPQANNWNDDRLDELSRRTDEGFKGLSRRTEAGFKEVKGEVKELAHRTDEGLKEVRQELNRFTNAIIVVGGGIIAAALANGIFG